RDEVRAFYEEHHDGIVAARRARRYFYGYMSRVLQARIPPGQRVLDIGCGTGSLLADLRPAMGVGVDISGRAIASARAAHPAAELRFVEGDGTDPDVLAGLGGPFDVILLANVVTHF